MSVTLINNLQTFRTEQLPRLESAAEFIMRQNGVSVHNVNIVLTDDAEISQFNEQYRKISGPTNVLSFPFDDHFETTDQNSAVKELGDIIISVETALREAHSYKQTLYHRLSWLMTHGVLHLLGYDHERSENDAAEMYELEDQLMLSLHNYRSTRMTHLAINIDHVATIRQARGGSEPDPVTAAAICELAGARGIAVHLHEDRRHIQERDVRLLRETIKTKLNLKIASVKETIKYASDLGPDIITLVPYKKQDLTSGGGLDVLSQKKKISRTIEKINKAGIPVSIFTAPDPEQVRTCYDIGATYVELSTATYGGATDQVSQHNEFSLIEESAEEAWQLGLHVHAGQGLNYVNAAPLAALETIEVLSIGHSIVSRALYSGLEQAVREMNAIVQGTRSSP